MPPLPMEQTKNARIALGPCVPYLQRLQRRHGLSSQATTACSGNAHDRLVGYPHPSALTAAPQQHAQQEAKLRVKKDVGGSQILGMRPSQPVKCQIPCQILPQNTMQVGCCHNVQQRSAAHHTTPHRTCAASTSTPLRDWRPGATSNAGGTPAAHPSSVCGTAAAYSAASRPPVPEPELPWVPEPSPAAATRRVSSCSATACCSWGPDASSASRTSASACASAGRFKGGPSQPGISAQQVISQNNSVDKPANQEPRHFILPQQHRRPLAVTGADRSAAHQQWCVCVDERDVPAVDGAL
jgi:hypothetical protein